MDRCVRYSLKNSTYYAVDLFIEPNYITQYDLKKYYIFNPFIFHREPNSLKNQTNKEHKYI